MNKVYISGALTNVPNLKEVKAFYEAIGEVCVEVGLTPYVPHKHTDPELNPDVTPQTVFETDKAQVVSSKLLIAYVGVQSLGVGMELAYADTHHIPIILLYQENQRISRMVRGIPKNTKIAEIVFDDYQDAIKKLKEFLIHWVQKGKLKAGHAMQRNASSKVELWTENEDDRILLEVDWSEHSNTRELLEKKLYDLHESGVRPSRIYVDIWMHSQVQEIISRVWPDVSILMEDSTGKNQKFQRRGAETQRKSNDR